MEARFMAALLGLLVLVFGVGALVMAVWGDDALESGARRALQMAERLPHEVNLFNPISGFGVAEGKDPAEEGYAAVTRVNKLLAAPGPDDDQKLEGKVRRDWVVSTMSLEDDEGILCSPKHDGCLAQLWNDRDQLRALATQYQTLLDRYRSLTPDQRKRLRDRVRDRPRPATRD